MATQAGKIFNFANVHLVIFPGFRVDAFDDGGIGVAWSGVTNVVKTGPDGIPVFISSDNADAVLTVTLLDAADAIDFIHTWLTLGVTKALSLKDSNGTTFLATPTAIPEQRAPMTFNATHNPFVYNILCPNFRGPVGALRNPV